MINKNDRLKAGLQPLLAKTLENALAHSIAKEFPRIGGPRICNLLTPSGTVIYADGRPNYLAMMNIILRPGTPSSVEVA